MVGKVFWASCDFKKQIPRPRCTPSSARASYDGRGVHPWRARASSRSPTRSFGTLHTDRSPAPAGSRSTATSPRWMESLGRPEDHAEMLAHHWRSALELARAAAADDDDLVDRTRLALRDAGDRAFSLNAFAVAERYYADALELWPDPDPERPRVLFSRARSLQIAADDRAEQALADARDALLDVNDRETAAEAEAFLSTHALVSGEDRRCQRASRERPGAHRGREAVDGEGTRPLRHGPEPDARGRPRRRAPDRARGGSRSPRSSRSTSCARTRSRRSGRRRPSRGDPAGITDLERALEIAVSASSPIASTIGNNLGVLAFTSGDLRRAEELYASRYGWPSASETAAGRGAVAGTCSWRDSSSDAGTRRSQEADDFIAECAVSPHYSRATLSRFAARFGSLVATATARWPTSNGHVLVGREAKDPQALLPPLIDLAVAHATLGDVEEARRYADEALELARAHVAMSLMAARLSHVAAAIGIREELRTVVAQAPNEGPLRDRALAAAEGDFGKAADVAARMGATTMEARHRLAWPRSSSKPGDEPRAKPSSRGRSHSAARSARRPGSSVASSCA